MAQNEKDKIAEALSRMASGEAGGEDDVAAAPPAAPSRPGASLPTPRLATPMPKPAPGQGGSAGSGNPGTGLTGSGMAGSGLRNPAPMPQPAGGSGIGPAGAGARRATSSGVTVSKPAATLAAKQATAVMASLNFRQTIIPPLLTLGVLLLLTGLVALVVGEDFVIGSLDLWVKLVALVAGGVLAGVGVANVLQVRKVLSEQK